MRIWSKKISLLTTPIPTRLKRIHGLLRRSFCMGKKNLNAVGLLNELKGISSFFPVNTPEPIPQAQPSPVSQLADATSEEKKDHRDTVIPRYHDTNHDTTVSSNRDTTRPEHDAEMLEAVRKAVKQIGKEPATQRLTLEEKQALKAIEFTYGQQGILTSGNEIIRIAMNYALKDYQKNGENSILAKVLQRLNS